MSSSIPTKRQAAEEGTSLAGKGFCEVDPTCLQKELGLPSRVAAKKLLLTLPMVKKRLRFCKKYEKWTDEDWTNVMFLQGHQLQGNNGRRPRMIDRFHQKYTVSILPKGCTMLKMARHLKHGIG
jgi:hypothetical protein